MKNSKPTTVQHFVTSGDRATVLYGPLYSRLQLKKALRRAKAEDPTARAGTFTAYHY